MKDETWGDVAWWVATILKWLLLTALVLLALLLAWILIIGH
jgi:hypothetical protein